MIKKKKLAFLLLGLGIGIISTNFVYYVSPKVEYKDLSDEEIIEKAKELGMVFVKDVIEVDNIVEDENPQKNISDEEIIKKAKELGMIFAEDSVNVDNIVEDKEFQENITDEETIVEDSQKIVFQIVQGQSVKVIAKNLYNAGLIDDKDEFINYAKERGITTRFRVGTYYLVVGMDYETLVTILTKMH